MRSFLKIAKENFGLIEAFTVNFHRELNVKALHAEMIHFH